MFKSKSFFVLALVQFSIGIIAESAELRYAAEDNAIVIRNGTYYNNRPLYGDHSSAFTLAGDRPLLFLAGGHTINGTFMIGMIRGKEGVWLHEASSVPTCSPGDYGQRYLSKASHLKRFLPKL